MTRYAKRKLKYSVNENFNLLPYVECDRFVTLTSGMRVTLSYLVIFLLGRKCEYIFFTYNWIYIYIVDVVEWSRALDVRLSEWCCSVTMVWVQIPSREEQQNLTALQSNSNTVWFNFQTYIYICLIRIIKMMKITEINRLCVYIMQER
jgi:hypothetical protein